ncbi:hypothetical protein PFISCL1PPCAC_20171, partial [Pristionchus fissidentatus]
SQMSPNISRVYVNMQLVAENVKMSTERGTKRLTMVDLSGSEEVYGTDEIKSLEFCFLETGPIGFSKFESIAILTFANSQRFFNREVNFWEPVILVLNGVFTNYKSVQHLIIRFKHYLTTEIVSLLPYNRIPSSVTQTLPLFRRKNTKKERTDKKLLDAKAAVVRPSSTEYISLSSDEEGSVSSPPTYYNIDGKRQQITIEGLRSLNSGVYMNDEVVNIAFGRLQRQYPHVHVFDSYITAKIFELFQQGDYDENLKMPEDDFNRHFGQFFLKKGNGKIISLPQNETFFDKKMLIFPICHIKHWLIVVVVNPLLSDVLMGMDPLKPKGHKPMAFYFDSLKGNVKYPHELLQYRLEITWRCLFSFLRLSALYHSFYYLHPELIECKYETNIPSQMNTFDCGAHAIVNGQVMAEMYEQLMNGSNVYVSEEKVEEVKNRVKMCRKELREYLDQSRI